jgi:zinc/manganese transport system substrate-binding protein
VVLDVAELSGLVPEEGAGEEPAQGEAHSEEEAHSEGEVHSEDEHGHGDVNEHFWYSLPTVQTLATRLAEELGAADAANAAAYTANAEAFTAEIAALTERVRSIGTAVPGGRVAVTEPIPAYLIETAGLADATPPAFAEAVEEDTDPPAAVVAETLALFTPGAADPIRALILNTQTQTPTTDQVRQAAEAAGVPIVEMTETLSDDQPGYVGWMSGQVEALASALIPV